MSAEAVASLLAVLVSCAALSWTWISARQAARAEDIKNLLGEKETVGYGALKLLLDKLPGEDLEGDGGRRQWHTAVLRTVRAPVWGVRRRRKRKQRELVIAALITACLFERSDRARSLLYRVIAKYRGTVFEREFECQFRRLEATVDSMRRYRFRPEEFNASSAQNRLNAVRKVLQSR